MQVKGLGATSGTYLVGFYLPGDVTGTGTVTQADIKTIKSEHGLTATSSKYTFDADANRDGVINSQDLKIARENLGVSTKVSPVVSVNLDPASDPAANRTTPFSTVHFAGTTTPGASVKFLDQAGGATTAATADSTGAYSIMVPLVSRLEYVHGDDQGRVRPIDQRGDLAGRLLAAENLKKPFVAGTLRVPPALRTGERACFSRTNSWLFCKRFTPRSSDGGVPLAARRDTASRTNWLGVVARGAGEPPAPARFAISPSAHADDPRTTGSSSRSSSRSARAAAASGSFRLPSTSAGVSDQPRAFCAPAAQFP